jgi:hypothetical protein
MAINRYDLYAVGFDTTMVGGITDQNLEFANQVLGEATSGSPYAKSQSLVHQAARGGFTSLDAASLLGALPTTGLSLADLTAGLNLFLAKREEGGGVASGAVHRKYTLANGILVPRQLTAAHLGNASLSAEILPTSDGTNAPLTITKNVSLPAGAADGARHTLGPVTIGGVSLASLRTLTVNFGINAQTEGADSKLWDTHASYEDIAAVITIAGIDPEWLDTAAIPITGKAATHANTTIYLRKRLSGGTFVADNVAEHIAITAAGLATINEVFTAGKGKGPASCALEIRLLYDGTNDPLVIDTASVIGS